MIDREEKWKDIKGYEGLYQISDFGRVKGLKTNKIMKSWLRGSRPDNKYEAIQLSKNGKSKTLMIQRLVAEAFIPNPENKPQVNHKDENKVNNRADNLEWCSQSYNRAYSINRGSIKYSSGTKSKLSKLSYDDVVWIKENMILGDSDLGTRGLGKKYNVDKKVISNIYYNKTYKDVNCKYNIYFCSDLHGDYENFIKALQKAGYNENKYNHKLVVLGDIFDRMPQNLAIYTYLKRLTDEDKAVVTSGNHHKFLIDYLEGTVISPFNYFQNGVDETLADFLGRTKPFESWCMIDKGIESPTVGDFTTFIAEARKEINEEYPELLPWLKSLPRFFESKNYIGVHAAIDTQAEDWHKPHCEYYNLTDWDALEFDDGSFFGKDINNTDKTVVIGHFGTSHLRRMYEGNGTGHGILRRKDGKVIAIDATTCLTKDVNVLVIENEEII